jgi:hypothetical protein
MMGKVIHLEDRIGNIVVSITKEEMKRENYVSFGGKPPRDYETQTPNKSGENKE